MGSEMCIRDRGSSVELAGDGARSTNCGLECTSGGGRRRGANGDRGAVCNLECTGCGSFESFVLQLGIGKSPYGRSDRRCSGVDARGACGRRGVPGVYPEASRMSCSSLARSVDERAGERNDVETSGHSPRDLRGSEYTISDGVASRVALITASHVQYHVGAGSEAPAQLKL